MDQERPDSLFELLKELPDKSGHFGRFGGRYVAETLMSALEDLDNTYRKLWRDETFSG